MAYTKQGKIRTCSRNNIDCDLFYLAGKLLLVNFNETVTIQEGEELEIDLTEEDEMPDAVSFGEYMTICGWTGNDDEDLDWVMGRLWATKDYYGNFNTVERMLCNPQAAIQFVLDYGLKLGANDANVIDCPTVLQYLMRLRKRKALQEFERKYNEI